MSSRVIIIGRKIMIGRSLLVTRRIRQFSSSSSSSSIKKSDKTQQLEVKEAQSDSVSPPTWKDFLFSFSTKDSSTEQALSPGTKDASNIFSTCARFFKQLVTIEENSGWDWNIKTDTTIRFGPKRKAPRKVNPTMKLSGEGLVVTMDLTGFTKDELLLLVQQNWILVSGMGRVSCDKITDAVKINPEHPFDAKKVTAEFVDGYVKVTLPKGTKETMSYGPIQVKWT